MKSKRKKEKSLKKSMKEKKRYLLLEGKVSKEKVEKAILDYIGILGYGKASPVFVKEGILAVNRNSVDVVKAALLLVDIKVKRVSGSLKGLDKGK